ncbi:hypothetical protein ABI59_21600 [Acidobacteria bacterium Mor1]|nr:hypothetical protein ABI59_21600 [Acidobacteria bacterium Mor1]
MHHRRRGTTALSFWVALFWSFGATCAQELRWEQLTISGPPASVAPKSVFDPLRGVHVLFGGTTPSGRHLSDTWEFDGESWTRIATSTVPPGRRGHVMAFDRARGVVVMFGGGPGYLSDTWEYDGSDWTRIATPTVPPGNWQQAMAYDPIREVMVMFGGQVSGGRNTNATWEYDGFDWRPVAVSGPQARKGPAMAWSEELGGVLLFGGATGFDVFGDLNDTWKFDGRNWTRIRPSLGPSIRGEHGMVGLSRADGVLLFGGFQGDRLTTFRVLGDLWRFRQGTWEPVASSNLPSPRNLFAMSFDPLRKQVLVHGGRVTRTQYVDETWVLNFPRSASEFASLSPRFVRARLGEPGGEGFRAAIAFELDPGSDGIDPARESIVIAFGPFETEIPAGSLDCVEGSCRLGPGYEPVRELVVTESELLLDVQGLDLSGLANPVSLAVAIGNDSGSATLRLSGSLVAGETPGVQ